MRLFVAVNLPPDERRALWDSTSRLRASGFPVKWVGEAGLHITLKFLGETDASLVHELEGALAGAVRTARAFDVTLGGLGAFPDMARPRVLWLGVERHPALELLANDVERSLAPYGFPSELRPFHPHITLGRAERRARPAALARIAEAAGGGHWEGVVRIESVDLMQSVLGAKGPSHTLLFAAPLLP